MSGICCRDHAVGIHVSWIDVFMVNETREHVERGTYTTSAKHEIRLNAHVFAPAGRGALGLDPHDLKLDSSRRWSDTVWLVLANDRGWLEQPTPPP